MKIKVDENGNVVVIDGNPVYLDDDDKEVVINVDTLYKKIQTVNNESASRKRKIAEMEDKIGVLEGIENPKEWMEEAKKALETVQNLSDKKLIDADKVDELKRQIKEAYDVKLSDLETSKTTEITSRDDIIKGKDVKIYNLMVSSRFETSPFFSGKDPKTVLLPDIAESYFGKHFKVEEDDNGDLIVAGYIGADRIPSRANPGEHANFEEAIAEIIDQYPMKDRILRAGGSGSGSQGNSGGGDDSDIGTLKSKYYDAKKTGNVALAISIKNQLHAKGMSVL
jgi:hypothetical protein